MRSSSVGIKWVKRGKKRVFVPLKWVKLESKEQDLNSLGREEGNGGFSCSIPLGSRRKEKRKDNESNAETKGNNRRKECKNVIFRRLLGKSSYGPNIAVG